MKKVISLMLALVMLLSTITLVFTSCDKETPEEEAPAISEKEKVDVIEGDIFSERAAVDDELPDLDFGGRELRVVSHDRTTIIPKAEKNSGSLISVACHTRAETVENRFNMKLVVAYSGPFDEVNDWVAKNVLSGADEFDLYSSHGHSAGSVALKNVFLNWYDIPNVDFTKPWWNPSSSDELTYDGKCILAVSDFNLSATFSAYCMIFNKNLANSYDFGNLYDVVLSGNWTYDYFYNLIKDVYVDSDGSGDKSEGDFFGFFENSNPNLWLWAFDNPIIKKDEEGVPAIAIKTEKINSIVEKIYDLCLNTQGCLSNNSTEPYNNPIANPFFSKRAIISISTVNAPLGESLRDFTDDYGLLPLPKWDENQKSYKTMALGEHSVMAVPKTCKDTEFVGTCIEALSAETYKQVIPTYYEIALKTRYLRDNESKEVLDLILEGVTLDFGYIYNGAGDFSQTLARLIKYNNSRNFESFYQSNYTRNKTYYKKIIKVFDKLG